MTTAVSSFSLSSQQWASWYEQQLSGRFKWAVHFIQANEPDEIRPHFHSLLTLLERAWQRPFLHPLAADLIVALQPLPYLWGNWEEWLHISRQSIPLFKELNRSVDAADILAGLVDMLFELGQYDEACRVFEEIWQLPVTGRVIRPLLRAGHRVSTRLILAGKMAEGEAYYEKQRVLLAESQPPLARWDRFYASMYLILQETLILRRHGQQDEAAVKIESVIEQVEAWAEAPLDLRREMYHHHSGIRLATGDYQLSAATMDAAIHCAIQMHDPFAEASLLHDKCYPLWALGRYAQVETAVRHSIHLFETLNADSRLLSALGTLIDVFTIRGSLDEALVWGIRHIELAQQLDDELEKNAAKTVYGIVYLNLGEPEQAVRHLEESLLFYQDRNLLRWLSLAESNLAHCWADLGDVALGYDYARRALAHAQEMKAVGFEMMAWRSMARFQTCQEKRDSLQHCRVLAQKYQVPYAEADSLLLLVPCGSDEAEKLLFWQQAVSLLQEMGLENW
ncbi:MAG: tetratricopeptide repeat protein, partial [Anaerolineae bacterium]|nr:tetratricopeptide repeat protein [Anaerolineae bacterium]